MDREMAVDRITRGETALGIELGSTRIKSVLIASDTYEVLAGGVHNWENTLRDGLWTYSLEDAAQGLQKSYRDMANQVNQKYGVNLEKIGAIGISGMMHGYLPLDKNGKQLAPFLTWRNTNTGRAADELTGLFSFNIPLRWSISHLYQAVLEKREHVSEIGYITTLAGYIHMLLTGEKIMGVGEASGMFPIDPLTGDFRTDLLERFQSLIEKHGFKWKIRDIMPKVKRAGENAGQLTENGAKILDPTGKLKDGIPMAPPEGDAGTGMVATNAVDVGTGNVSAGTSIFSMVVLEKDLSRLYRDIDIVTTPSGHPVAMVHCNNGTSELDAWVRMFGEITQLSGGTLSTGELYERLFRESLKGDPDCSGIILFNYLSGEPVTGLIDGKPLQVRDPESRFTLANFMRAQIYSIVAALSVGMKILDDEKVQIKRLTGHGGLFKTEGVAQRYLAMAVKAPIAVMEHAGEGGAFGMAVLAAYRMNDAKEMSLGEFLDQKVFGETGSSLYTPSPEELEAYGRYLDKYCGYLELEKIATKNN